MNALQFTLGEKSKIRHYETGLFIQSRNCNKKYFNNLNEAIDAEYTKRAVLESFATLPVFQDEKKQFDRLAAINKDVTATGTDELLFDGDTFWAEINENNIIQAWKFPKQQERKMFDLLTYKIFQANKNKYKTQEDVFREFAEVNFAGGIGKMIKLIDGTFGRGTTQKLLAFENSEKDGKPFNDIAGQLKFAKRLGETEKDEENKK